MTKAEAKKRLLGFMVVQLSGDDEALFGDEISCSPESQEYRAMDAARNDLIKEFDRRGAR